MVALNPAVVLVGLKTALKILTLGVGIKKAISELGVNRVGTPNKSVQSLIADVPKIEAVDLNKLFRSNKVAAKAAYQDRIAIVSGRCSSVSETRRHYKIKLTAGISHKIDCRISKTRVPQEVIIEVKVGQPIHVLGVVKGKTLSPKFTMEYCTIAE